MTKPGKPQPRPLITNTEAVLIGIIGGLGGIILALVLHLI